MKKVILIFGFILSCQFLANGQDVNITDWNSENQLFYTVDTMGNIVGKYSMDIDSSYHYFLGIDTVAYHDIDTTAITLLVTACQECPAHAIKGFIFQSVTNSGYLDEYKQPLDKKYIVWDYRERKVSHKNK